MLTHKELVTKMLRKHTVKTAYDNQAKEFASVDELLCARQRAGLTRPELAKKMEAMIPNKQGRSE